MVSNCMVIRGSFGGDNARLAGRMGWPSAWCGVVAKMMPCNTCSHDVYDAHASKAGMEG